MTANMKFVDGTLLEVGPYSTTPNGNVTEMDYLRIEKQGGEDIFLPKSLCCERIKSYLNEALGQDIRLFYAEAEIAPGQMNATILGIEMASGKRYSTSDRLDNDIAGAKKLLAKHTWKYGIMWAVAIAFICSVVLSPVGLIVGAFSYRSYKIAKVLKKGIAAMPSSAQFSRFFAENSRGFARHEATSVAA